MSEFSAGMMHKVIPPAEVGAARIIHDSPDKFTRLRASLARQPLNCDTYTRLLINGELWMTDAEYELATNYDAVRSARGDVLIAGLGIGFILRPMLAKPEVSSVTVIERSADVIALVSPHFPAVKVIEADAYAWEPPSKAFDFIYFDIWPNVPNADDLADIKALKTRYRKALRKGGKSAAWCESIARGGR